MITKIFNTTIAVVTTNQLFCSREVLSINLFFQYNGICAFPFQLKQHSFRLPSAPLLITTRMKANIMYDLIKRSPYKASHRLKQQKKIPFDFFLLLILLSNELQDASCHYS